jgi:drug/metabolite transporter (DMT)-like permease
MQQNIKNNNSLLGVLFALCATLFWSGNFVFSRLVGNTLPPIQFAFYRWLIAAFVMLLLGYKNLIAHWPLIKKNIVFITLAALIGISIYNTMLYYAAHFTLAMNLTLIGATSPFITVIIAAIFLNEKPTTSKIIGMLLCFCSILFLLTKGHFNVLQAFTLNKGDAWMLCAAVLWATYTAMLKKKPNDLPISTFQTATFLFGMLFLIVPAFFENKVLNNFSIFNTTTTNYLVILYTAFGPSLICFYCWGRAVQIFGPSSTAIFINCIPIFTSFLAPLFLIHETTQWYHFVALAGVLAGVVLANKNIITAAFKKSR